GIFTGVTIAEMVAKTGKSLSELLKDLEKEYGVLFNGRSDVSCPDELKQTVMEKLSSNIPNRIAGIEISNVNRMDGLKFLLKDDGWLLIRPSGTEPLFRIYGESTTREKLEEMLEEGKKLVTKALSKQA
ncbi:phosphoglucomutase/phosphomannomutase family protein, partial [Candidatus Bathyarchaeota archaeon]|nr:phosphoglucomutase/phosphomannomutase family protein [Candidatus Bathyarchaeota archaeon]